jgi:hypothetical protein
MTGRSPYRHRDAGGFAVKSAPMAGWFAMNMQLIRFFGANQL